MVAVSDRRSTPEIALATVSGRAYYLLVRELRARGLAFLSLKPTDRVPLGAKVVITTEGERPLVNHPNVLTLREESDISRVIDEAVRSLEGKRGYSRVVIGVDPGGAFGVAVVGDERVLETVRCASLREAVDTVSKALEELPARAQRVRVGDGAPEYAGELLRLLDRALPERVSIEVVREAGTSRAAGEATHRRELQDAISAIKIAGKNGRVYPRGKKGEARGRGG